MFSISANVHGILLRGIYALLEDKSFLLPTRPAQLALETGKLLFEWALATYQRLNASIRIWLIYCQVVFLNDV